MRQREAEKLTAERELATLERATRTTWDSKTLERDLRARLAEWRELLRRHVPQARQVIRKLLVGPMRFTPHHEGRDRYYEFAAQISLGHVFSGIAPAIWVESPICPSWNQLYGWLKAVDGLRCAA
jgi:hypothetical protein